MVPGTKDLMRLVPAALVSLMGTGKEEDPPDTPGIRNCSWQAKRRGSFHLFILPQKEKLFPSGHLFWALSSDTVARGRAVPGFAEGGRSAQWSLP